MPSQTWPVYGATPRQVLIALAALGASLLLTLVALGAVASFLYPTGATVDDVVHSDVGPLSAFQYGVPRGFVIDAKGRVVPDNGRIHASADHILWLVRTGPQQMVALVAKNTSFQDCTVPWRPDFRYTDPRTGASSQGWFRDPCSGSTYDFTGQRVFGPAPRDLDRYPVVIAGQRVLVKTGPGTLQRGEMQSVVPHVSAPLNGAPGVAP